MASDTVPIDITEAAGDWLDRLSTDNISRREREAFAAWLLKSPVHVQEYLHLSAVRAELSGTFARHPDWVESLLDGADANVVALPGQATARRANEASPRRRRWQAAAAVIGIAAVIGWIASMNEFNPSTDHKEIATALGEQRSVLLSDGSTIELNTESGVRIRMTGDAREIDLLRGEVMFDVAKDPNRPFRVSSDGVVVEAIGTRFNVYRREADTIVTVVEGRVAVNRDPMASRATVRTVQAASPDRVELTAGLQVAVVRAEPIVDPMPVNLDKATAWTERRLVFDDEALSAIVAEFNRYNRSRVIIDDPELNARRLSGVFDANDTDEFIALLSGLEAIEVRRTAEGHRALARVTHNRND